MIPQAVAEEILLILKKDIIEVPPPPGKPVFGPCWIPKSCISVTGQIRNRYTTVRFRGEPIGAHVLAASLLYGTMPDPSTQTLHGCDLKCCRIPSHLRRGTAKENSQDAFFKGLMPTPKDGGMPCGEKNCRSTMSDADAANIKWCLCNEESWYSEKIRAISTPVDALASIHQKSPAALRRMKEGKTWRHLQPKRPLRLPTFEDILNGAPPPAPSKDRLVSDQDVVELVQGYPKSEDKLHYSSKAATRLKCSSNYIYGILCGAFRKNVRPDIPRIDFSEEARKRAPVEVIQAIRATWDAYKADYQKRGLFAAFARKFHLSRSSVRWICDRTTRMDVPDNPNAVIPFCDLPLLPLTQKGANNKLAKLDDGKVYEILKRLKNGESKIILAKEFRISVTVIYKIGKGETWRHVWEQFCV